MSSQIKKTVVYFLAAVFFVTFDRFLKILAIQQFSAQEIIITNFFKLSYQQNVNIAFSLPLSGIILNLIILIIIIAIILFIRESIKKNNYHEAGLLFIILSGALSNFYDRLRYGFVIDYFDLKYFTVFNIADVMISLSVVTLITLNIFFTPNSTPHSR